MNRKSTVMIVLLAALGMHARVFAQSKGETKDSLLQRLRNIGHVHVGLQKDQRMAGYVLYTYADSQHRENLASVSAHLEELNTYAERVNEAKDKLQAAEQLREHRNASASFRNELFRNFHDIREERPTSKFVGSISLFDVVRYGSDYLELHGEDCANYLQIRNAEVPEGTVLIPMSKICKIVVGTATAGKAKQEREPCDETKSPSRD